MFPGLGELLRSTDYTSCSCRMMAKARAHTTSIGVTTLLVMR